MKLINGNSLFIALLLVAAAAPLNAQSVYASNLNNPRGLRFGPDGLLYVAEGGTGGLISSEGECDQVVPPTGPYTGDFTARILKIDGSGNETVVADSLPSSQTSPGSGSLVSGVSDLQFVGNQLYALLAGAGCSHGLVNTTNGILQIANDGSWTLLADLSAFQKANPVENPNPGDFEPDGTWYAMVAVGTSLFAVEPNHGEIDRVTKKGKINRVVDISAFEGHVVPSSLTYRNGYFYTGNLGLFPITPGTENVYRVNRRTGAIDTYLSGFTTILGLTIDRKGRLYILESMTQPGFPGPGEVGEGTVVRRERNGKITTIVDGLSFPSAMTIGPDGKLYISNWGFAAPPGMGEILQVDIP